MATVTFKLTDFGLDSLAAFAPEVVFTPSGPAVNSTNLLATRPIVATPNTDGTGVVDLAPTDDLRPEGWYAISMRWLDASSEFIGVDFPNWRLYVPPAGGALADLIVTPWNPGLVWAGPTAPAGTPTANTMWLNTTTGDLSIWSN